MPLALIVDDRDDNLYFLRVVLERAGYTVQGARHGAEALVMARASPPAVVITDLLMPVMDGYTMLRQWRADPVLAAIPVVVYTATYTEPQDEQLALDLGADAFVVKPAEPDAFVARLTAVLASRRPVASPAGADEQALLSKYSAVVVRKLEEKAEQLHRANQQLQEEAVARESMLKELEKSEGRYRGIFENNHAVMLLVDFEAGLIVDANPAAARFYGWSRDQLRAMRVFDINTLDRASVEAEMARARAEQRAYFRFTHRLADGSVRDVEVFSGPVSHEGRQLLYSIVQDVTERRRAERALRESSRQLGRAQELAKVGSWTWHVKSGRLEWSDEMYRIFGLDPGRFSGDLADVIRKAVHPEDRAAVERANELVATHHRPEPLDYRVVWPDGSLRQVRAEAGALTQDEAGRADLLTGIVQDVTDQRQTEARLRRLLDDVERSRRQLEDALDDQRRSAAELADSERRYRLLFDANPHPMWIYDIASLAFLAVNDAAIRRYGYDRDQFLAMTVKDIRPPEDVARLLQNVALSVDVVQESGVWRHRLRGGEIRLVEIASHAIEWEGRQARLVLAHDVTAQEQARRALEESEERLRRAVNESPFPIMIHAEDGHVLQVSRSWSELTGYAPEDIPTIEDWTRLAYGERSASVREVIDRLYDLGTREAEGDFTVRTRDGALRTWEFSSAPLGRLPDGRRAVISMAMDVTERRHAEAAVRALNAELEQRVADRTLELTAANRELEAFSYSVSHDLRAPLRAINGFARIMVRDHAGALSDEGLRVLDVIRTEAVRMGQLVDDLLQFSKLSRHAVTVSDVDMTALVRDVTSRLLASATGPPVHFDLRDLPTAQCDPALMRQVWVNLVGNAMKFTRGRDRAEIRIEGAVQERETVYSIADNGVGFDMQFAGKLFGVFQRLHAEDQFEGTGVGLALVQRIVHRHGGRVWAEAEPDRGAIFHVALPREPRWGRPPDADDATRAGPVLPLPGQAT